MLVQQAIQLLILLVVQLEVGSVATDFEHRSFAQELALCQRYYYQHLDGPYSYGVGGAYNSTRGYSAVHFPVTMRGVPTLVIDTSTNSTYNVRFNNGSNSINGSSISLANPGINGSVLHHESLSNAGGYPMWFRGNNDSAKIAFNAEI